MARQEFVAGRGLKKIRPGLVFPATAAGWLLHGYPLAREIYVGNWVAVEQQLDSQRATIHF